MRLEQLLYRVHHGSPMALDSMCGCYVAASTLIGLAGSLDNSSLLATFLSARTSIMKPGSERLQDDLQTVCVSLSEGDERERGLELGWSKHTRYKLILDGSQRFLASWGPRGVGGARRRGQKKSSHLTECVSHRKLPPNFRALDLPDGCSLWHRHTAPRDARGLFNRK